MDHKLLEIIDLKKYFYFEKGLLNLMGSPKAIRAVDGVSFDIDRDEVCGLIGESGCGKTTLGKIMLNLYSPTEGIILYNGSEITGKKFSFDQRKKMQMIFQDPFSSLNPVMTAKRILEVPLKIHMKYTREERKEKLEELLKIVGIDPSYKKRYPHEFSGGQRQRIVIARALSVEPEIIIADEPISKLDVSIQAQILNLLMDLQKKFRFSILFISHDINVVRHISNRVIIMYMGEIVELGHKNDLFNNPLHPYTQALLSSVPQIDSRIKISEKKLLGGEPPSLFDPPRGCRFHTRCERCMEICRHEKPEFMGFSNNHRVACHLYG